MTANKTQEQIGEHCHLLACSSVTSAEEYTSSLHLLHLLVFEAPLVKGQGYGMLGSGPWFKVLRCFTCVLENTIHTL